MQLGSSSREQLMSPDCSKQGPELSKTAYRVPGYNRLIDSLSYKI